MKKPMLAAKATLDDIKLPAFISPKIDGVRCLIYNGRAYSRKLKLIRNHYVQSMLLGLPDGLDGELVAGNNFCETSSAVMSFEGAPSFNFLVFDVASTGTFADRLAELTQYMAVTKNEHLKLVPQHYVITRQQLHALYNELLLAGFEGICARDPYATYKEGRSTLNEGALLKIKHVEDAEATVVGFVELMHNENLAERDELGHTKRSKAQAGLMPADKLGALVCKTPEGVEFEIGTGFTDEQRRALWQFRDQYYGAVLTYTHQPHGSKDKPRQPVFKGFRSADD